MSQYDTYPNLWTPQIMPFLFVVKVPPSVNELDEDTYKSLMLQRVDWMIGRWMKDTSSTQLDTQRLLEMKLSALHPSQDFPQITSNNSEETAPTLEKWQIAWAETLVYTNHAFNQAINLLGVTFPSPVMTETHPEFQDFLALHQEVYLEEWLTDLTSYA